MRGASWCGPPDVMRAPWCLALVVSLAACSSRSPPCSETCSGCCNGEFCIALAAETHGSCGANGLACGACAGSAYCDTGSGACRPSRIEHVVLIVQENHSFDSYFGRYCGAAAGSNPECTVGRRCCEAAPA